MKKISLTVIERLPHLRFKGFISHLFYFMTFINLRLRLIQADWWSNNQPTRKNLPSPRGCSLPQSMTHYILSALHVKRCGHRPPWMTGDSGKESIATLSSHVPDVPNVPDVLPWHPVQPPQFNNPCMDPFTSSWCPSWHPTISNHGLDTYIWFTSPHTQMHIWCGFLSVSYNWWISLWKWLCSFTMGI